MEQHLQKMKKAWAKIAFTPEEKAGIRARVVSFMRDRPLTSRRGSLARFFFKVPTAPYWKLAPVFLIILLFVGGGISGVADTALPGDALYRVKTGFNEEVRGFFAGSSEAKAEFETELATRRLDEIDRVAEKSDAREVAEAIPMLEARVNEHLIRAEENAQRIEVRGNQGRAQKIREQIEKIRTRSARKKALRGASLSAELLIEMPEQAQSRTPKNKSMRVEAPRSSDSPDHDLKDLEDLEKGTDQMRETSSALSPLPASPLRCFSDTTTSGRVYLLMRFEDIETQFEVHKDDLTRATIKDVRKELAFIEKEINEETDDRDARQSLAGLDARLGELERLLAGSACPLRSQ